MRTITLLLSCVYMLVACDAKTPTVNDISSKDSRVAISVLNTPEFSLGRSTVVELKIVNLTKSTIPSLGFNREHGNKQFFISYHWFDANMKPVIWEGSRVMLPHDLRPHQSVDLSMAVMAPDTNGSYILEIDAVQEGVRWFKDAGSPVIHIKVKI